jgi:hypothetical protein
MSGPAFYKTSCVMTATYLYFLTIANISVKIVEIYIQGVPGGM